MYIRDMTSEELSLFARIVCRLQNPAGENPRSAILADLLKLLRADGGCSYVWHDKSRRFGDAYFLGMSPEMETLYTDWFQFHDPMSFKMRSKRRATIVDEVLERSELIKSSFYNDLLKRDSLEWGINVYSFDSRGRDLGDLRFWRRKGKMNFDGREKMLLDVIEPIFQAALLRDDSQQVSLTTRERDVAQLLSRGCTDRDISRILGISFSTVRTHVNRTMEKFECSNRTELAARYVRVHGEPA